MTLNIILTVMLTYCMIGCPTWSLTLKNTARHIIKGCDRLLNLQENWTRPADNASKVFPYSDFRSLVLPDDTQLSKKNSFIKVVLLSWPFFHKKMGAFCRGKKGSLMGFQGQKRLNMRPQMDNNCHHCRGQQLLLIYHFCLAGFLFVHIFSHQHTPQIQNSISVQVTCIMG